jgi:4-diphosphocytidyl-2-C-methyl-D-erythritol kinase
VRAVVRAQAKVNLFLHVLAREESGYHSIETLFHRIDLCDDVEVRLAPAGERTLACDVDFGAPARNLAFRAAEHVCREMGSDTGFHISLRKRIPAGAGLGGGSADAGAVARAMARLLGISASERLIHPVAQLGADIPFLASDAVMALAWGRGERMLALPPLPPRHVVVLMPPFTVSTADAYRWVDAARDAAPTPPRLISIPDLMSWESVAAEAANGFTAPVSAHTGAAVILRALGVLRESGARIAMMSGSGSALFGVYEDAPDAELLGRETGCRAILTRTATAVEAVGIAE